AAIHGATGRVTGKTAFERHGLYFVVELEGGIEGFSRRTILHQFDRLEQTAPSDVADVTVIAEPLGEPPLQVPAEFLDLVEQLLFADHALHFQSRRAGHRVSKIGMSV